MGDLVIKLGMIGLSEGNGHPFSFSAIFNGYSDSGFAKADWPVIHDYLKLWGPDQFGIGDARVTHAWTQDPDITSKLCAACLIDNGLDDPKDMIGNVDAVIIARDDYKSHAELAMPFLQARMPVFIDKPLTVEKNELKDFIPYLKAGKLMSCGGMRYAVELDEARTGFAGYGDVPLIRAAILNDWDKYGIHMIDAVFNLTTARPIAVSALNSNHDSMAIEMDNGSLFQVDTLGNIGRLFRLEIFGREKISQHDLVDNFSMFRRTLQHFIEMVHSGEPQIPVLDTVDSIRTLIAGRQSAETGKRVTLNDVFA
jgi:predicted dehydrogenase